MRNFTQIDKE